MTPLTMNSSPPGNGFSLIPEQKLVAMYSAMMKCREIAQSSAVPPQPGSRMYSILGKEAAVTGVAIELSGNDTIAPSPWPESLFRIINPLVSYSKRIPLAAPPIKDDCHSSSVAALFSCAKKSSQLAWRRTLDAAIDRNLPILFVSISHAESLKPAAPEHPHSRSKRKRPIPSITVDGNDVVAVYRVGLRINRSRSEGPWANAYRLCARQCRRPDRKHEEVSSQQRNPQPEALMCRRAFELNVKMPIPRVNGKQA